MTPNEAADLLEHAVARFSSEDSVLLELDASERAMVFRLAHYIAQSPTIMPPLTVDCEYNRHLADKKKLDHLIAFDMSALVLPDILIHQRNSDDYNLVVIEVKKEGVDFTHDRHKLVAFRKQLGYTYAAQLILGKSIDGKVKHSISWIS